MLAVGASVEQLEPILNTAQFKSCQIACINAPTKTVVSGPIDDLNMFRNRMQSEKIHTTFLEITYGFHSPQVDPILRDFEISAKALNFARPAIPVASTLIAGTIVKEKRIFSPGYLARQAREPVNFAGALQACEAAGLINTNSIWFEVGPEPVNLSLVRNTLNLPPKSLLPILKSSEDNWKTVSHAVSAAYTSAITVDWTEYHKEYTNALSLLELPSYAFDLKDYWASYSRKPGSSTPLDAQLAAKPLSDSFSPSTTLQHLLQQPVQSEHGTSAVFSSALSEPMLLAAIKGHLVDGTALCPASVFCDMAFAAAKYLFTRANPDRNVPTMVLEDLEITHPLVASDKDVLQQTVEVNASRAHDSALVKVSFSSRDAGSSSVHEHGSCAVRVGEAVKLRANHHDTSREAKAKLEGLVASAKTGQQLRLPKLIVYKLFASLVDYKAAYQSMDEVYLDNSHKDAAASVRLTDNQNTGTFTYNPYWIDAVIHLAGFVLNGDVTKPDDVAYISTGFKELFILEPLKQNTEYFSFSSIQAEDKKGVSSGHVYVFQEQRLVAVCAGITFQRMTKNVLKMVMGKSEVPTKSNASEHSIDSKASFTPVGSSVGLASTAATSVSNGNASQIAQTLLAAVASETGYSMEDMGPSASFADMGVDSLMSIAIVSAVKSQIGVELPGSFFQEHLTVADVMNEFTVTDENSGFVSASQSPPLSMHEDDDLAQTSNIPALIGKLDSNPEAKSDETVIDQVNIDPSLRKPIQAPIDYSAFTSHCVLVQGRTMSKATPLYLIADGAGSAAAYIHLPPLPSGGKIYALESPFLSEPTQFTCSVEEVAGLYLTALRQAQPEGPYLLGGWSAGGVYAYEVSRQLLNQGETVLGLIIIDMRVPKPMPDGMEPTMELVEEAGLVLGLTRAGQSVSTVSKSTKQHLLSTVKALMVYKPPPMDPIRRPGHTCLIWAKKGLKERESIGKEPEPPGTTEEDSPYFGNVMEDPRTGLRSWFFAKRTNFGPNGWDKLVGEVDIHTIDGDHFSIVVPPQVSEVTLPPKYYTSANCC
jgi:iterative type I PKS product template protein